MPKTKQSPSSNDGLGEKGKQLIDSAKILAQSNNPVKLIAAQIRYRMLAERMYRQNARVK